MQSLRGMFASKGYFKRDRNRAQNKTDKNKQKENQLTLTTHADCNSEIGRQIDYTN